MSATEDPHLSLIDIAKRAAVVAAIMLLAVALATFFWKVSDALLVAFVTIVFAVFLDGMTRWVVRRLHLPRALALALVVVVLGLGVLGVFAGGTSRVASQAPQLEHSMQQSLHHIEQRVHHLRFKADRMALGSLPGKGNERTTTSHALGNPSGGRTGILSHVGDYLSTSLGAAADWFVILIAGIYLAASPRLYIDTPVKLAPRKWRPRLRQACEEVGHALRRWLLGRFASMLAVGLVTGVGLTLLGVKLAALLAVIAAALTFIPYLGAIISMIPAILVALLSGPWTVAYVVMLYLGAHALEGYLLTPLIQARTVHLAPGWLILSQLVGGVAAGVFGILIAAPLLVTLAILVQLLYQEDVLGDQVQVLGSGEAPDDANDEAGAR